MTGTGTRRSAAALALALTALLSACSTTSQQASDIVSQDEAEDYRREVATQEKIALVNASLPSRPAGLVEVDGATRGTLTRSEATRFEADDRVTRVDVADHGEDSGFEALCRGEVDLVDSTRPISREEWDACRAAGLDVVQFQVASDAVVLATKSETDVGGDCLTTGQVRDLYRAGSPAVSWSQVGLDDVPLQVGGPAPASSAFDFFGRHVLDAPNPSLTNLRSDYAAFADDQGSRQFVVGNDQDWRTAERYADRARLRSQAKQAVFGARQELAGARQEVQLALAERAKGIRDGRSPADQAADQQRVDAAYTVRTGVLARVADLEQDYAAADAAYDASRQARARIDALTGRVAYFRFSYYELFEEQLRPFEVTMPDGSRNCVFPSQLTITDGSYPLSRQLLITTTTRSLERREVGSFLESYLGHAQRAAGGQRLVALPDEIVAQQRRWLTGEETPELVSPEGEPTDAPAETEATSRPAR